MHYSFKIIYVKKILLQSFFKIFIFTSALQGSNLVESLAGVVTGMLIFFHINLLSFFIIERLPVESSALSRQVIRNVTAKKLSYIEGSE